MLNYQASDDEHWAPISDLMAVLMLMFMLIAIVRVGIINEQNAHSGDMLIKSLDEIRAGARSQTLADVYERKCDEIYRLLKSDFDQDFKGWQGTLTRDLSIRFSDRDIVFEKDSAIIQPRFKKILSSFFPAYMHRLSDFSDDIEEIRIEGHTSSEYEGKNTKDAFIANMKLSHDRARAILEYVLNLPSAVAYEQLTYDRVTANGLSSSNLLRKDDGSEDVERSRRVEFRLLTNSCLNARVYRGYENF